MPRSNSAELPLALTMGEPAGIGGEVTLKAWLARADRHLPVFFTLDDPARLQKLAADLGLAVPVRAIGSPAEAKDVFAAALPVLPMPLPAAVRPGHADAANAPQVIAAIRQAVTFCQDGQAAAIVTNPINKAALYGAGFRHPGHTEFIADLCGVGNPVMMLASDALRVVLVSIHVSLLQAISSLSVDGIVSAARTCAAALQRDFGIAAPRLAVAGLNPHAGEAGAMGNEDQQIVAVAVKQLQLAGIQAVGPLPPDTMFHAAARAQYDAAICMYHDQGLIPLKTLDFDGGVNVTLGLPIIRTSPDHGTAFDIAGRGIARPDSLIAALRLAAALARNRAEYDARIV